MKPFSMILEDFIWLVYGGCIRRLLFYLISWLGSGGVCTNLYDS